ncbi:MAG: peptidylprolyl isomerase [Burkholderiaceae bacterium]|nr:peptidylprolyl isomerase [Burkholderiaceae bacterium]
MRFKLPILGAVLIGLTAVADDGATAEAAPRVQIKTSAGEIVVELYPAKAPRSVENFLEYVKSGHYDGTIFHRVIGNFMIQGGGFDKDFYQNRLQPKPTRAPIALESQNGLRNDVGWVAMARTGNPNSATSQFFINTVNNDGLNYPSPDGHGYAVFGKVVAGMEVVNVIRALPTTSVGPMRDVPVDPVAIESVRLLPEQ